METSRTETKVDPDINELVPGFCESRKKDLVNLNQLLSQSNFVGIAKVSHTIKGVARPYGFPTLEAMAVALEKAAKSNNNKECMDIINTMDVYLKTYTQ